METNISHHDINKRTRFTIDKKKHEAAKRKYEPKTKIQRLKSVFYILTAVWVFCQVVSALLCSTGLIHFTITNLSSNGFIIIPIVVFGAIFLEWSFNKVNNLIAEQKYDDETEVSPVLHGLRLALGCVYAASTFFGTPYSVAWFAAPPEYNDIALIESDQNKIIESDTLFWTNQINDSKAAIASFVIAHSKYDEKIDTTRLRSGSVNEHKKMGRDKDTLGMNYRASLAVLQADKKEVIRIAKEENKAMNAEFEKWCGSFGFGLSLMTLICILIFIPSFSWCARYKRDEIKDNDSILAELEAEQAKELSKEKRKEPKKVKKKEKVKKEESKNEEVTQGTMQDIFKPEKEKNEVFADGGIEYIWHELQNGKNKGSLVKRNKREYRNMLNNCTKKETIKEMKKNLKKFS